MSDEALQLFSAPTRAWFASAFAAPSPAQRCGWPVIAAGDHALICAPTGSGKTLAAFLWCLDRLFAALRDGEAPTGVHTLYISPLKALGYDIERNLRAPLRGVREAARQLGLSGAAPRVAVRTGDTPAAQRAAMVRTPPQLLITTPESLFIILTSPRARDVLRTVRFVIVDEIHALCGNKRGASLALCLERVATLAGGEPQRIGLSATVRPPAEAARFLGGQRWEGEALRPRPVTVVDVGQRKELDVQVAAPVPDFTALPEGSVWPAVHERLHELVRAHRSTLIFVRMRAQAERLSRALCELAGSTVARAHHSSMSPALRRELEEQLKAGRLPALVSTGTMELGVDMGAIDLVVQLGSPGSVMTGLQRVGRAGHLLGERSCGRLIPLYREDLVECAVIGRRILDGQVEALRLPRNALDVVAQHVVSTVATDSWTGGALLRLFRQAAPYAGLTRDALDAVLALLGGRYPADVARGLSAKLVWERSTDRLAPLRGARQLATTAGGTIPDRGYFALQLPDGTRLGELEEEFVFERRVGDAIAFGSSTWRILEVDRQRVVVAPAPGQAAVIPFWKGGLFGRDGELSEAIGAFRRALYERIDEPAAAEAWLRDAYPVDSDAAANLVRYFADQRRRGAEVGSDRSVVVESFLDDLGDHRLVVHACFGNRVNSPWGLALRLRLRERLGIDPQVMTDDNAILVRVPAGSAPPPLDLLELVGPDEVEELVVEELASSAMFGTLFRQNAARFLVLGLRGAGQRTPLWLQRLRAKDLLEATRQLPDFPVRLETYRECLQELMDLPRLRSVIERLRAGEIRVTRRSDGPSPVAAGLLTRFIGQYMYEYDEPRAERTLRRLLLDRELLDQLLGRGDLAALLLPEAVAELQAAWQGESERRRARDAEELLALLQRLVLLPEDELAGRCAVEAGRLVAQLLGDGRARRLTILEDNGAPRSWLCASDDLPLLAGALGGEPRGVEGVEGEGICPGGGGCGGGRGKWVLEHPGTNGRSSAQGASPVPLEVAEAQAQLVARVLDSLGPVTAAELATRCALRVAEVEAALGPLREAGRVVGGALRTDLAERGEHALCTRTNLEQIRRRSIAVARRQVEPVGPEVMQRMVLELQQLTADGQPRGAAGLEPALEALSLLPLPAEILERDLLSGRVPGYQPAWLDEQVAAGAVLWTGSGPQRLRLLLREQLALLPAPEAAISEAATAVEEALRARGASFVADLVGGPGVTLLELRRALWELVWAGRATNDRFDALRAGLRIGFETPGDTEGSTVNALTGRPSSFAARHRRPPRAGRTSGAAWSGRWSLLPPRPEIDAEERLRAQVDLLLGRYGLVARELVALEAIRWSELYPLLREMELLGDLRRGLFVRGLSGAQFAPGETVDRLRALREARDAAAPLIVSACDPALVGPAVGLRLPPGATLARRPTSYAVLEGGELVLAAESGGRSLFLVAASPTRQRAWLALLPELLRRGQLAVTVERINGEPAPRSPLRALLEEHGFRLEGATLERRRLG